MLCVGTCCFSARNTLLKEHRVMNNCMVLALLQSGLYATELLTTQKRLTKLPALCWAGHAGCGYGNLQQRWHHPWTDLAPVTSRYKNVTFLLYLDIEFRTLTGLYVLKVSALLQVDWEGHTRNRTFMSSCSNLPIPHHPAFWEEHLPAALGLPPLSTPLMAD